MEHAHDGLALLLVLVACDPGDVKLLAPATNGGAQVVSIHAVIDTPCASLATELGWTAGIPGATVRVHLMTEPYDSRYWHVATTDSLGFASFAGLLSGLYEVEVSRELTASEMTRDSGVRLLAGGYRACLPSSRTLDLTMIPAHRGSLVFSEFGLNIPAPWETGGSYEDAKYFEVYNNADSTVYLDGKYWGIGWDFNYDYPKWPCAQTEAVRDDPEGIWTRRVFRFPGRGTDYPLAPGGNSVDREIGDRPPTGASGAVRPPAGELRMGRDGEQSGRARPPVRGPRCPALVLPRA